MKYILFALFFVTFCAVWPEALASTSAEGDLQPGFGVELYCAASSIIRGSVGTLLGFAIALAGFLLFLASGSNKNIILIVIGIAITAYPGFFEAFLGGLDAAISGASRQREFAPPHCRSMGTGGANRERSQAAARARKAAEAARQAEEDTRTLRSQDWRAEQARQLENARGGV